MAEIRGWTETWHDHEWVEARGSDADGSEVAVFKQCASCGVRDPEGAFPGIELREVSPGVYEVFTKGIYPVTKAPRPRDE